MIIIKNDTFQSFSIFLATPAGGKEYWLRPNESILVQKSYVTEQIRNMQVRKQLKISQA